jgi:hypothetical protein
MLALSLAGGATSARTCLSKVPALLTACWLFFGANETQLPYFGEGNCYNWTAGAVGALEKAGLALPGDGEWWAVMVGKGPLAMQTSWVEDMGRQGVPCEKI